MDEIINSLKTRRALGQAMLNPGKKAGFGGSLLLNSSSLQPQRNFRQLKASFSVKRPLTLINSNSLSSFSKQAETKYSDGQSLLHLKPASASSGPASVQRMPAPMPLPSIGGGAAVSQSTNESAPSFSSPSAGSTPSYPPKSERRPVMFEKTDGPSDFEKRIMAAKKQKAEQAAKQRGPDRRQVRTERVEISSSGSGSNEVQREFLDAPHSAAKKTNSAHDTVKKGSGEERWEAPASVQSRQSSDKNAEKTIQRRLSDEANSNRVESVQDSNMPELVQREIESEKDNIQKSRTVQRERKDPSARISGDRIRAKSSDAVQRESLKSAELLSKAEEFPEMPVVQQAESEDKMIQRESLDTLVSPMATSEEPHISSNSNKNSKATVRREPVQSAKPVKSAAGKPKTSTGMKAEGTEIVRREPLKSAEPVKTAAEKPVISANQNAEGTETVRREPLKSDEPMKASAEKPVMSADRNAEGTETVRREPLKSAEPVKASAEKPEMPAGRNAEGMETVRREPLKSAEPVRTAAEKPKMSAVQNEKAPETVQREPLKASAEKAEMPAVQNGKGAETVQREPLKSAEPVKASAEMPSMLTIQREPQESVESVKSDAGRPEQTAVTKKASGSTVRREPLKTAKPVKKSSGKGSPESHSVSAGNNEVRREAAMTAQPLPNSRSVIDPWGAAAKNGSNETIQRESLKSQTADGKTQGGKSAVKAAETINTVQREEDDLMSLLNSLPTHYEMPKEQIEAIRSGKSSRPSESSGQHTDVMREMADNDAETSAKTNNHQPTVNRQTAEAVKNNIIRREPDFILPKLQNKQAASNTSEADVPSVQREFMKSSGDAANSAHAQKGFPGLGQMPGGNFGQKSFPGMPGLSSGPSNSFSGGQASGFVQREMADERIPEPLELNEPSSPVPEIQREFSDETESTDLTDPVPEVTAQQLEILADKLLPRIKRIMRNEMERSIFR